MNIDEAARLLRSDVSITPTQRAEMAAELERIHMELVTQESAAPFNATGEAVMRHYQRKAALMLRGGAR